MKSIKKKQIIASIIVLIIITIALSSFISNRITIKTVLKNNGYNATNGNSSSNLIAEYIKQGVTLGGI